LTASHKLLHNISWAGHITYGNVIVSVHFYPAKSISFVFFNYSQMYAAGWNGFAFRS